MKKVRTFSHKQTYDDDHAKHSHIVHLPTAKLEVVGENSSCQVYTGLANFLSCAIVHISFSVSPVMLMKVFLPYVLL